MRIVATAHGHRQQIRERDPTLTIYGPFSETYGALRILKVDSILPAKN